MENLLEELTTSWAHCKELIRSKTDVELVIAFLEDFKIRFTTFYNEIKNRQTRKFRSMAFNLVDKVHLFGRTHGELSLLISYVKTNWNSKHKILNKIEFMDVIISKIIVQYTNSTNTSF